MSRCSPTAVPTSNGHAGQCYTFRWKDPDPEDQETIVTLSLEDLGNTTEIEFSQGEFATERRRALHDEGWANSLDRLHELMSSGGSVD